VPFRAFGGYEAALATLDELPGIEGFVWREYSPASVRLGVERRYFTEPNAARIDAIRRTIATWHSADLISPVEAQLLIADLLAATNRVANIAGTYGCFLRDWTASSLRQLNLVPRPLSDIAIRFEASCLDVFAVATNENDAVYLDPPYTKRQYAAYYHVLETIAEGDAPRVGGVTGLRPWEHKASAFCYKARALKALVSLITGVAARRVLVSYSDDAHIGMADLISGLAPIGDLRVYRLATIGRYRPNEQASANRAAVSEYLLELRKPSLTTAHNQIAATFV
jgi:adenine-specific DNA-methyltransferase